DDLVAVVALDLDLAVLHRAAAAARLLELAAELLEVGGAQRQAEHDRQRLAVAHLAAHAHDAVAGWHCVGGEVLGAAALRHRLAAARADAPVRGVVDEPSHSLTSPARPRRQNSRPSPGGCAPVCPPAPTPRTPPPGP